MPGTIRVQEGRVSKPKPSSTDLQSRDRHSQGSQHIVQAILNGDKFKEENKTDCYKKRQLGVLF